ncbi:hypothetical protein ACIQVO_07500 [Streptomyces sp. NPDC101062]|uniref:hypothetical protein n=1 Tax=unclassified Streptomyces TaxID=2593676 RepID=UPI0038112334
MNPLDVNEHASEPAVTTWTKRRIAVDRLLSSAPSRPQAKTEWEENGAAWLRPGGLFSAVVMQAGVLQAAAGLGGPEACTAPVAEVLEYGPLFYSPTDFRGNGAYTALLPVRDTHQGPPLPAVVTHHQAALLLVPRLDITAPTETGGPWWVSPLDDPDLLCPAERVAVLATLGRDILVRAKERQDV